MPEGHVTVLGGLPVIAEVWFTCGDGYSSDDDAGVDGLFWITRKGKKGKEVSQRIYDRLEKRDPYWECAVVEQVSEQLAYEASEAKEAAAEHRAELRRDDILFGDFA